MVSKISSITKIESIIQLQKKAKNDEKLTKLSIFALKLKFCCFKYLQSTKIAESIVLIGFFTRCKKGISHKIHKKL